MTTVQVPTFQAQKNADVKLNLSEEALATRSRLIRM